MVSKSQEKALEVIAQAQKLLEEARQDIDLGNFDIAVEKCRQAWKAAQAATQYGSGRPTGSEPYCPSV